MSVDFGADLKDQVPALVDTLEVYHSHLSDVASFYAAQAEIERSFAEQQQSLLRKAHEKRSKRVEGLVAGAAPAKIFKDGDQAGRSHTIDGSWARMLSATSEIAAYHNQHAQALDQLSNTVKSAEDKSSSLLKAHQQWYHGYLLAERDRVDTDRSKRKEQYDSSCADLESARQKQDSSKDTEKAERNYNRALADMECAKDAYLASIRSSNRSAQLFFARDLPAVHRHMQTLWTLIVSNLADYMRRGCAATDAHLAKLKDVNARVLEAISTIDPVKDQQIYVDFNARPFFPPADKQFEPCALWHDTADPILSAPAKAFLQNLAASSQKLLDTPSVLESKEKEIDSLANIVQTYSREPALGNAMEAAENMLSSYRQSLELRLPREAAEADYDFCHDSLAGDLGSQRPHDFKTASFPTPHPCTLCGENIWGLKQGMKCRNRACPAEVHSKCATKIAASCLGSKPMATRPRSNSNASSYMTSPANTPSPSQSSFLHRADSSATTRPTSGVPSISAVSLPPPSASASTRSMVFDFQGSTELELDVQAGTKVAILEPDNQGWTRVRDVASGREGLVPTAYMSSDGGPPSPTSPGLGQYTEVKIAYTAAESGEVSVAEGDHVKILDGAPEGWAMVQTPTASGLVPQWAVE